MSRSTTAWVRAAEQRADRRAGQHQGDRVGPAAGRADREDGGGGEAGARQREPGVAGTSVDAEDVDAEHDGERRAGRDAEQAGVGERVAGVALHQRAGDAEADADHDREHGAGDAQLVDDGRLVGAVGVEQHVDDGAERDVAAPDGQAEQAATTSSTSQHDDPGDRAAGRRGTRVRGRPGGAGAVTAWTLDWSGR